MPLVSIDAAMHHLRADPDDQVDVARKLAAAEIMAANYMGRDIFADSGALLTAHENAINDLNALVEAPASATAYAHDAKQEYNRGVVARSYKTMRGIVIDPAIEAGILLILGTLYEHREDVVAGDSVAELPIAATHRLQPYRIYGV